MIIAKKNIERTNLYRELIKHPDIIEFLEGNEPIEKLFDFPLAISAGRRNLYRLLYKGVANTPVYSLPLGNNNILKIKLESDNNMGNNHYSRYWLPYLFLLETLGVIEPYISKIVEVTSGSAGISLAMACKELNYDLNLIIPDVLPIGRTQPMLDAGAKLIKVKGYINECINELHVFLKNNPNYFPANHSDEKSNLITYIFSRIAYEYCNEEKYTDIAILGIGNGSSTEAIGKTLRKLNDNIKIYGFYPSFNSNQTVLGLLAPNLTFRHLKSAFSLTDEILFTNDADVENIKETFKFDPVISQLGISSLYAIQFALQLSENSINKKIFIIGYDLINRYEEC